MTAAAGFPLRLFTETQRSTLQIGILELRQHLPF